MRTSLAEAEVRVVKVAEAERTLAFAVRRASLVSAEARDDWVVNFCTRRHPARRVGSAAAAKFFTAAGTQQASATKATAIDGEGRATAEGVGAESERASHCRA